MLRESKFRRVFMVFSHLQLWGKRCEKITSEEESLLWSDVKPCAMSDEETDDEDPQMPKHRRPSWRSEELNELIDTLDARNSQLHSNKKNPSKKRVTGPLLQTLPPPSTPNWMVRQPLV